MEIFFPMYLLLSADKLSEVKRSLPPFRGLYVVGSLMWQALSMIVFDYATFEYLFPRFLKPVTLKVLSFQSILRINVKYMCIFWQTSKKRNFKWFTNNYITYDFCFHRILILTYIYIVHSTNNKLWLSPKHLQSSHPYW